MDILKEAYKLGEAIRTSPEYIAFQEMEARVMADDESVQLLNDLSILQKELEGLSVTRQEETELVQWKRFLESKKEEINEYEPTRMYFATKKRLDAFMDEISRRIQEGITGKQSSCGGACAGCKACGTTE